jgi:WD40 repeat protein/uncharacterized caspase-like protein
MTGARPWIGLATLCLATANAGEEPRPELVTQFPHAGNVTALAIAPNNRFIVTGGADEVALLWDVESGRQVRQFSIFDDPVTNVDISADSSELLSVQGGRALIWDVKSGELTTALSGSKRQTIVDRVFFGETHRGTDRNPFRDPIDTASFAGDSGIIVTAPPVKLWRPPYRRPYSDLEFMGKKVSTTVAGDFVISTDTLFGAAVFDTQSRKRIGTIKVPFVDGAAVLPGASTAIVATRDGVASYDVRTAEMLRSLSGPGANAIALDPAGKRLAIAGHRDVRVVMLDQSEEPLTIPAEGIEQLTWSRDSSMLLTSGRESIILWDAASGDPVQYFGGNTPHRSELVAGSADGRFLAVADADSGIWIWDLEGLLQPRFVPITRRMTLLAFQRETGMLVAVHDELVSIIDPLNLVPESSIRLADTDIYDFLELPAVSPDGTLLAQSRAGDYSVEIFDLADGGRRISRLRGHQDGIKQIIFSPSGQKVATAARDGTVRLWRTADGNLLSTLALERTAWLDELGFRNDDTVVTIDGNSGTVFALRPDGWSTLLDEDSNLTEISQDGRRAATNKPVVFDLGSGRQLLDERLNYYYTSSLLSHDGRWLFSQHAGGVTLWDVDEKTKLWEHLAPGQARGVFLDGKQEELVTAIVADGQVELLDFRIGRRIARLVGQSDGTWIVITDDGRFDTNNIDAMTALSWVLPGDRMKPLPIEIFMREYFQPGLLLRALKAEPLPPVVDILDQNILQPAVAIEDIRLEDCLQPNCVSDSVTVVVSAHSVEAPDGGRASGVRDVRLFRDGRLVGHKEVVSDSGAVVFRDIRLPSGQTSALFTAYAFNSSLVKSETAAARFDVPPGIDRGKGTAYVITVGVNSYANPAWDLTYAANDASAMSEILSMAIKDRGEFDDVIAVPLLSDDDNNKSDATKFKLREVFARLSGSNDESRNLVGIKNADRLRAALPEDIVIVSYSSHGYADAAGLFYLFPRDIALTSGRNVTDELLASAISSEELALWLRDIDAGDLILIVDACHSAASVEGADFVPGPMGSRGLGQLAYDKGMRVLAASQADRPAYETSTVKHGLLTYTMIERGLKSNEADFLPKDGSILLSEWLNFAPARTERTYDAANDDSAPKGVELDSYPSDGGPYDVHLLYLQRPSLFDFAKHPSIVLKSTASN